MESSTSFRENLKIIQQDRPMKLLFVPNLQIPVIREQAAATVHWWAAEAEKKALIWCFIH